MQAQFMLVARGIALLQLLLVVHPTIHLAPYTLCYQLSRVALLSEVDMQHLQRINS